MNLYRLCSRKFVIIIAWDLIPPDDPKITINTPVLKSYMNRALISKLIYQKYLYIVK